MKGFNWSGDLNGHKCPWIKKMVVPDATAIENGEPIDFTQGTGVVVLAGPADFDDPITGVSMNEKAASDGQVELEVSYSPTAIYKYVAGEDYTLTANSSTTQAVISTLQPQTNNIWKGGAIKIVSCAADDTLNGRVVKIASSVGATGALVLAETLNAALATGDTIKLCLGNYADGYLGYDLDSTAMHPDFEAVGGTVLKFHHSEPELMEMYFTFERFTVTS